MATQVGRSPSFSSPRKISKAGSRNSLEPLVRSANSDHQKTSGCLSISARKSSMEIDSQPRIQRDPTSGYNFSSSNFLTTDHGVEYSGVTANAGAGFAAEINRRKARCFSSASESSLLAIPAGVPRRFPLCCSRKTRTESLSGINKVRSDGSKPFALTALKRSSCVATRPSPSGESRNPCRD